MDYYCKIDNPATGLFKETVNVYTLSNLEENSKHFDVFEITIDMKNSQNVASVSVKGIIVILVVLLLVVLIGVVFYFIRRNQKNYKFNVQQFDKIMKKKYVDF